MWDKIGAVLGTTWDLHPTLLVLIVGLAAVYAAGVANRRRVGRRLPPRQAAVFAAGIVLMALTLGSPLHHLADSDLFSAHMAQHLVLTLFVPPLLLLGTPEWLLMPVVRHPFLSRVGHHRAYAIACFVMFNVLFAYAHLPIIYDTLFGFDLLHRLTHIVFLVTAVVTWLPLLSPVPRVFPRISPPAQMLYAFAHSVPGALIGSLLTLADRVLYTHYGSAPERFGVSPLADQQVGGLLMWVVGGTYWLVILTVVFFIWADREERHAYG
ncbi:MAG TPA: cytochrome c oxidase assembly protein [Chloroflexota bacterium]|nr:cytochrome c oxidase assembly protein [Chloroflexota bacterium]